MPPIAPAKASNGLGLASLIVGIVALVGSFIPFLNYGTGIIAFIGIVLGVVALFIKGRSRGIAIAGTAISVLALILSIILAITYTAGFANAVKTVADEVKTTAAAVDPAPADTKAPEEPAAPPAAAQGTRENPYPIGSTVEFSKGGAVVWTVSLGAPTLNANDVIANENQFNQPAPEGFQFAMLPVNYVYSGTEAAMPGIEVRVDYVSVDGHTYSDFETLAVEPNPLNGQGQVYGGASGTGNVAVAIPTATAEQGTWSVKAGLFSDPVFFAAQ